jgi:hypothetical protein
MENEPEEIALDSIKREIAHVFGAAGLESFCRHGGSVAITLILNDFRRQIEAEQQRKDRKEMWEQGYEPVVGAFLGALLKGDLLPNPDRTEQAQLKPASSPDETPGE